MEFTKHLRTTLIEDAPSKVAEFVQSVPNLLQWTHFFVAVQNCENGRYAVETLLGPATTWIEVEQLKEDKYRLDICSVIHNRHERASVYLSKQAIGTEVTFAVNFPTDWSAERLIKQLFQVDSELEKLKELIEENGNHSCRHLSNKQR
jgi:hypothetical protein